MEQFKGLENISNVVRLDIKGNKAIIDPRKKYPWLKQYWKARLIHQGCDEKAGENVRVVSTAWYYIEGWIKGHL